MSRIALPLASLTAVGGLATDLHLPAVPYLPEAIGGTAVDAQLTLASFMGALAFSQIFWGWASDRFGEFRVLMAGTFLQLAASVLCALCSQMDWLIIVRAFQGWGGGAATAVVPALLRKTFNETDSIKAISLVGMAEALAPALGPILGGALIAISGWRASFWLIAILTAVLIPVVYHVTSGVTSSRLNHEGLWNNLSALFKDISFLKASFSYAIMFGALFMFVSSAPQLISTKLKLPVQYFSVLQISGVLCFMATASQSGKWVERFSSTRVLRWGASLQITSGIILSSIGILSWESFLGVIVGKCLFTAGLGLRGPSLMAKALSSAGNRAGQASGLLMFFSFGLCSGATAAIAPFLKWGIAPVGGALLLMTLVSIALASRPRSPR